MARRTELTGLSNILAIIGKPFFWVLFGIGYLVLIAFSLINKIGQLILLLGRRVLSAVLTSTHRTRKILFTFSFLLFTFFVLLFWWQILKDLPGPGRLTTREQVVSTKIYDRHHQLLYTIYRQQNRTPVSLDQIPNSLRQATIAIEDAEFYNHHGFSIKGILRSLNKIIREGKVQGGSTITQQLVKNALLTPEKTFRRKIKEIILSLEVELRFNKDKILEMYFNEVGYGGATYGVEQAAQTYFGKSANQLNLAESAYLAGLPASPSRYSPFGAHPELAKERQKLVLKRMVEEKYITSQQAQEAEKTEIHLAPQKIDIQAPHFVMYVKELLAQKYGEKMVEQGGLEVITSLDLETQNLAQETVSQEVENLVHLRVTNGAALVTVPATGEILAMVGSKDYFDIQGEGNYNVTTALRQPGSAIKPVNYSVALQMGFTPATVIPDTPITYKVPGQPPYTPKNYDGRFHGNVSLRTALGSSYNVPAVKVLSAVGVSRMIEQGQKMGITTWDDPSRFGLSLTLGGGEVKMIDMAVVYGSLANLGTRVDLQPILEVKDYKGKVLEKYDCGSARGASDLSAPCNGKPILNPQIAYILTDILSDNSARTPAFGPRSQLNIAGHPHVAVKTGTTQNLRDNWTIGYTPDFVVAVWVGNNDNTPMSWVASGVTGASPIWNKIMTNLLKDTPDKEFPKPAGLVRVEICPLTGTLPCEGCGGKWEYFVSGTEPKFHCDPQKIKELQEAKPSLVPTPQINLLPHKYFQLVFSTQKNEL